MMDPDAQKALLYCPSCWHQSPPDGDWVHERRTDGVAFVCPTCDSTVTVRPAREARVPALVN